MTEEIVLIVTIVLIAVISYKLGADIAGMKLDKLTPGLYLEMKRQGKSDRYVYQTLRVTGLTFRAWRDENMEGYEYD